MVNKPKIISKAYVLRIILNKVLACNLEVEPAMTSRRALIAMTKHVIKTAWFAASLFGRSNPIARRTAKTIIIALKIIFLTEWSLIILKIRDKTMLKQKSAPQSAYKYGASFANIIMTPITTLKMNSDMNLKKLTNVLSFKKEINLVSPNKINMEHK